MRFYLDTQVVVNATLVEAVRHLDLGAPKGSSLLFVTITRAEKLKPSIREAIIMVVNITRACGTFLQSSHHLREREKSRQTSPTRLCAIQEQQLILFFGRIYYSRKCDERTQEGVRSYSALFYKALETLCVHVRVCVQL